MQMLKDKNTIISDRQDMIDMFRMLLLQQSIWSIPSEGSIIEVTTTNSSPIFKYNLSKIYVYICTFKKSYNYSTLLNKPYLNLYSILIYQAHCLI